MTPSAPPKRRKKAPEPPSMAAVAAAGGRRDTLVALRGVVAAAIDSTTSARDLAALARLLVAIVEELDGVPDVQSDVVDDLLAQRAARRAAVAR